MKLKTAVGHTIRVLREANDMTIRDLARDAHVSIGHISAIERGIKEPSLSMIDTIIQALEVPPKYFWEVVTKW